MQQHDRRQGPRRSRASDGVLETPADQSQERRGTDRRKGKPGLVALLGVILASKKADSAERP